MQTVIQGYAAIIARYAPPGTQIESAINGIIKAAAQLQPISQKLLVFSPNYQPDIKPLNLNDVIRDNAGYLELLVGTRVEMFLTQNLPPAMIDREMFVRLLANLAINSKRAMSRAPLREFTIETAMGIRPGTVMVRVHDTGCGMQPHQIEKIMRNQAFTTKEGAGGYGFQIVSDTITRFRGYLEVSSPGEDGGTAVTMYFRNAA